MSETTGTRPSWWPEGGRLLTPDEVAEICRVHPMTVRRWIWVGRLPAMKLGRREVRVDPAALEAFLAASRTAKPSKRARKRRRAGTR